MADVAQRPSPTPWDALGVDGTALRVYEALLVDRGADLTAALGLSRDDVAGALAVLRQTDLVRGPEDEPQAVRPDIAVEALIGGYYARLADESGRVVQLRQELDRMVRVYRDAALAESTHFEVVRGLPDIQHRLAELTRLSHREVLCMVPRATKVLASSSEPLLATNREAAERGVSMRTLLPDSVADDPDGWGYAQALIAMGDDVRTCPSIALVSNIFDRRWATVPLDTGDTLAGAVVVTSPSIVAGLVSLFEQLWATSLPIACNGPAPALDARDRQLLELLLRGAKDEQVARTMGMSVRTVRNRVSAMAARAGARSRFQLAAVALHHGWISVGDGTPAPRPRPSSA